MPRGREGGRELGLEYQVRRARISRTPRSVYSSSEVAAAASSIVLRITGLVCKFELEISWLSAG